MIIKLIKFGGKKIQNNKNNLLTNPFLIGLISSAIPYFSLLLISFCIQKISDFFADPSFAVFAFVIGIIFGGTTAYKNKLKGLKNDFKESKIIEKEEEIEQWERAFTKKLYSRIQFRYGSILIIIFTPIFIFFTQYIFEDYGIIFYISYIGLFWLVFLYGLGNVLWVMILELIWLYYFDNDDNDYEIIKLGLEIDKKYSSILPILNVEKLRLKIKLLHPDKVCGLKPLISLALFGAILEAIVFSSLLILYINIDDLIGLFLAISLAIFIVSSALFAIDRVRRMVIPARTEKMDIILSRIEKKHKEILKNKKFNSKENIDFLDLHEKILKTYYTVGRLPIDAGVIAQLISGAAIPLILFFLGRQI